MAKLVYMHLAVDKDPYAMYTDRLSDHAVMKGEIALSKKKDPAHQSLPDWICRSAAFKEQL
eukprot:11154316-Karenia_brevis.AAC.1